jgi:polysaccharide biosynthesis/export protein
LIRALPLAVRRSGLAGPARLVAVLATPLMALAGCADLPSSGPTVSAIVGDARDPHAALPFDIVDVTPAVIARQAAGGDLRALSALPPAGPVDVIGPGDVLQISVFEVGVSLFSGRSGAATPGSESTAIGENLPQVTVDRDGQVLVPYVGAVQAAGLTPTDLAAKIQAGFAHHSQAPQVVVSVHGNVANTVMVLGDVKKPGRVPLTLGGERVLDAIAEAGGAEASTPDNIVRLIRGGESATASLATLHADSPDDIELRPQDRVEVNYRPRTFTVFGATGKAQEIPFQNPRVSLAEAVARTGGPSDQQADPSAVFVFRYEPSAFDGSPLPGAKPVAYRLNLLQAQSYFLAQRFEMKSRDVIYIANARANQLEKMMQILNLFFEPAYTAKVISQ